MAVTITWYGQNIYLLKSASTSIIVDPYFSDSCAAGGFIRLYAPPVQKGELAVDYVISTHDHGDHLDIDTLKGYIRWGAFYGPSSCVDHLKKEHFAAEKLHEFNRGQKALLGDFSVQAVHAEHLPDSIGVIVESEGKRLYITGDTLASPKLDAIAAEKPDYVFICINGKFGNMTWQEAVVYAHTLKVKAAFPCHYDLFAVNAENPALFAAAFQGSPINCRILERGRGYGLGDL
ncbi:MBL fold metallo-hydrolase [Spirochaetia bacterium]|nr:MBL fold metallo-hydrolase [Spirochaetia bacterium]